MKKSRGGRLPSPLSNHPWSLNASLTCPEMSKQEKRIKSLLNGNKILEFANNQSSSCEWWLHINEYHYKRG